MTRFSNNPYPDVPDYFGQYTKWKQVVLPSGEILYEVPGHPERVFDPALSNASGRVVLKSNPQQSIADQKEAQDANKKAQDRANQAASPAGQIGTVALGTLGTIAGYKYGIKGDPLFGKATPPPATFVRTEGPNIRYSDGSLKSPSGDVLQPGTSGAPQAPAPTTVQPATQAGAAAQGSLAPAAPGTTFNGSAPSDTGTLGAPTQNFKMNPDGSAVAPDGSMVSPTTGEVGLPDGTKVNTNTNEVTSPDGAKVPSGSAQALAALQLAGGVMQAYGGYKQYQSGEKIGGAANVAGGAYNAYAAGTVLANGGAATTASSYVPYVGAGVAAANIYDHDMRNQTGKTNDRAANAQVEGAKSAMLFIPGWGWVAYAALAAADALSKGKASQQLARGMHNMDRFNDRIDFGVGQKVRDVLFHQSTEGVQMQHSGELSQVAPDDAAYQDYLGAMRSQVKDGPPDPTKPYAGKYASWDDYKKGGLEAGDLTGVYGNIKAYGPAWAALTEDQRKAVTQANIDSDLYSSKMGDVNITDEKKAKENFDNVMKGFDVGVKTGVQTATNPGVAPILPGQTPGTTVGAAKIQPIQPGQTPQSTVNYAVGPMGGIAPMAPGQSPLAIAAAQGAINPQLDPRRTISRSPGIGLDGRRIVYR